MDAQALSEEATLKRFNAQQDRVARDFGFGDTEGALAITKDALPALASFIQSRKEILDTMFKTSEEHEVLKAIEKLPSDTIALAVLNAALASIATCDNAVKTRIAIGRSLQHECWAAGLLLKDADLARRISAAAKRKHGRLKYRQQAARSVAARCGYQGETWREAKAASAGIVMTRYLLDALPGVFVLEEVENALPILTISPEALSVAESAVEHALRMKPSFYVCIQPPAPWTSLYEGGYWDHKSRLRTPVVRAYYPETRAVIKAAIEDGSMRPTLDALNALQSTAWTINKRVLGVLHACLERGIEVKGLPELALQMPTKLQAWKDMEDDAKRLWRHRASLVKQQNRTNVSSRVLMIEDLKVADLLSEYERFWTPMNLDWRGRVYPIPHFNFQRDDRVRALFLFADGEPIGEEGLYWLKVHVANCGDFDKISKRPFDERVKWIDDNLQKIEEAAHLPIKNTWWSKADKPFLFLAACMELISAMAVGSAYITSLPISFDGSCSGLQHLSAMTRDADTAALVNLTPNQEPKDVYSKVAELVSAKVERIANNENLMGNADVVGFAKQALAFGINRKLVKRNVMTYSYSSKKFGMGQQLVEDLMRPLAFDVLAGKLDQHPFGDDEGQAASRFLAGITYEAIEELVSLPAQAMAFLQKCSRAMAHEGKPVTWTTPLGLPWVNRYHVPNIERVSLWLHDKRIKVSVADGHTKTIDKEKAANGVAPNFVHALDACHLLMVAKACADVGITSLATVHDSFGCLAPQAGRFRQIIREQFVKLYDEHNPLAEVLEACSCTLTLHNQQRLPNVPDMGRLNLKEVLNAEFAFA